MKLYTVVAIAATLSVALTCCSASKNQTNSDEKEIVQLCNYTTYDQTFYANGIAESTDMQMAKDKAISSARAQISASLNLAVENFVKRFRTDTNDVLDQKTEDRLQTLTIQTLTGSSLVCERLVRTDTGKYRAYVSVALPKQAVIDAAKKALDDEKKANLDTRMAEFDKIAEQEIIKAGVN